MYVNLKHIVVDSFRYGKVQRLSAACSPSRSISACPPVKSHMRWTCDRIKPIAGAGRILVGAALVFSLGGVFLPLPAAELQKGTPETPSGAAAVAGTFICHDGNVYRVVLTLNTNGTYSARGSSCLKNKGDASGPERGRSRNE